MNGNDFENTWPAKVGFRLIRPAEALTFLLSLLLNSNLIRT